MSPTPAAGTRFHFVDPDRHEPAGPEALIHRSIPPSLHSHRHAAHLFRPDAKLATAVNVAISVGAPLLVTGEPGTGKTQIAWWLAWYFGLAPGDDGGEGGGEADGGDGGPPWVLNVKSTTVSRDLLYHFDPVAYFHAGQARQDPSRPDPLDPRKYRRPGPLWRAVDDINQGRPSIILIDEIDKAPRDFPNDLLHELDEFEFKVPETRESIVRRAGTSPPIVIVTSNSERRLPEPFLRRCVFHSIAFTPDLLRRAVEAHRAATRVGPGVVETGIERFMKIRAVANLRKKPATAEFLMWMVALDALGVGAEALGSKVRDIDLPAREVLIKDAGDLETLGRR